MPEANNEYWLKRMELLQDAQMNKAADYLPDLDKMYRTTTRNIEKELASWYQRFATNNKITLQETRKFLDGSDLKELQWDLQEYIQMGESNALDPKWIKQMENASAKVHISRLESLKLQVQQQVEVLYGNQLDQFDADLRSLYKDSYYKNAWAVQQGFNVGWDLGSINTGQLDKIMSKPWSLDGATFSDRIWTNKAKLITSLQTNLTRSIVQGKAPDQAIKEIAQLLGTYADDPKAALYQAGRLYMTESAAFASIAQKDAFKDLDVQKYEIVATLDNLTSQICTDLDGETIDLKDYEVGITAPPFHPWCRTTTAPFFDDEFALGERAARDPETGKTYYVPSDMKYPDWKKTFVDGGSKTGMMPVDPLDVAAAAQQFATNPVRTVDDLQTPEEVQEFMKEKDWFYKTTMKDGTPFRSDDALSLAGCDLESAKEIFKAHEKVFDKYPQLIGELNAPTAGRLGKYTMANCSYGFGRGGITVNTKYYDDHIKFAKTYADSVDIGHSPKGTDWTAVVTHELGHAVDDYLSNTLKVMGMKKNGWQVKEISSELRRTVMRSNKMTMYDVRKEVSEYATKTYYEWFAECFAEYINSPSPRLIASDLGKRLDEIMEGVD